MKRKIKFRAWDKEDKIIFNVARIDIADGSCYSHLFGSDIYDYWNNVELMQYTGLKDKNGVEIYEGDIVRIDYGDGLLMGIMEFHNFAWCIKSKYKNDKNLYYPIFCEDIDLIEILGNIYENPELLKNK